MERTVAGCKTRMVRLGPVEMTSEQSVKGDERVNHEYIGLAKKIAPLFP